MDFDTALEHVGEFGRHQTRIYFIVSLISVPLCSQMLIVVFIGAVPEWKCHSPNGDILHCNSSHPRCCDKDGSICPGAEFTTGMSEISSIATEWDLACGNRYKTELTQSIYVFGYMFGVLIFGILSDKYGRRRPWLFAYIVGGILTVMSGFVQTYEEFITLRFAMGLLSGGGGLISYVLSSVSIGPSYRGKYSHITFPGSAGTWQQGFYAFGYVVLTLEAYFIRDWRTLTFFSILPSFVVLFIFKTIPESPRWLASQGKIKEAEHILRKIGKENGSHNNEVIFLKVDSRTEGKTSQHGALDLFTHRSVCPVTGIMMLSWCVNSMVYYGLALNVKNLGGSLYINFVLASLIELPSFAVTQFFLSWLGRRKTLFCFLLGGSLSCFLCMFLQSHSGENTAAISMTALAGRFCISASFAVLYVYSAELFPTVVRNAGMGISSLSARVGGMVAPFIVLLGDQNILLPMLVFALTALLAAMAGLKLHETQGRPLPETFEDLDGNHPRKVHVKSNGDP